MHICQTHYRTKSSTNCILTKTRSTYSFTNLQRVLEYNRELSFSSTRHASLLANSFQTPLTRVLLETEAKSPPPKLRTFATPGQKRYSYWICPFWVKRQRHQRLWTTITFLALYQNISISVSLWLSSIAIQHEKSQDMKSLQWLHSAFPLWNSRYALIFESSYFTKLRSILITVSLRGHLSPFETNSPPCSVWIRLIDSGCLLQVVRIPLAPRILKATFQWSLGNLQNSNRFHISRCRNS